MCGPKFLKEDKIDHCLILQFFPFFPLISAFSRCLACSKGSQGGGNQKAFTGRYGLAVLVLLFGNPLKSFFKDVGKICKVH